MTTVFFCSFLSTNSSKSKPYSLDRQNLSSRQFLISQVLQQLIVYGAESWKTKLACPEIISRSDNVIWLLPPLACAVHYNVLYYHHTHF